MTALALTEKSPIAPQQSAGELFPIPHKSAVSAWQGAVAPRVGVGKEFSRAEFALRIGIGKSGVERWFDADTPGTPGFATFLSASRLLGPEFVNAAIAPSGVGGARRLDGQAKPAGIVLAEMAGQTAVLADALKDGHINRIENAEMRRTLPALIETLQNLQAQLARESA